MFTGCWVTDLQNRRGPLYILLEKDSVYLSGILFMIGRASFFQVYSMAT